MRTIITIILTLCFAVSEAQTFRGGEIFRIKDSDVYWAAVKTSYFREFVARQEEDCWCWAACVQIIVRYNGQYVSQRDIAARVFGENLNRTASGNQIESAFDGWQGYTVHSYQSKKSRYFIDEISSGHPLIIGIREHAYLLTHIYYKKTSNGLLHPFKAILINPKTGKEEVWEWNDFYFSLNTIVSIYK